MNPLSIPSRTLTRYQVMSQAINFNLERFLNAQDSVYEQVVKELRSGQKITAWMWFIFPMLKGLGSSPLALHFGITSLDEAAAYLRHPQLGTRLAECTRLVTRIEVNTVYQIFGSPDDFSFQASMTLFDCVSNGAPLFHDALVKFFDGQHDPLTLGRMR